MVDLPQSTLGYHIVWPRCCRNIQDNLPYDGVTPDQGQTYYCFIPKTIIGNSSPVFSGVPSPYMCARDTTSFLFGAYDPDGDSLSYKIVRPFKGGSLIAGPNPDPPLRLKMPIDPVIYKTGYNEIYPFGFGGMAKVDPNTGFTYFYAYKTGSYVVGIEVTEWRNGQPISSIRMDLQILVLDCPPNKKPIISSIKGNSFTTEAGEKLCFDIVATDPDKDNVTIHGKYPIFTGSNGWVGPTATFSKKTMKETVSSTFCWTPSCGQASSKPYNFVIEAIGFLTMLTCQTPFSLRLFVEP